MKLIKYIKNPKLILYFLDLYGLHILNDKDYLKCRYKLTFNKDLDLDNPKSFNEKLQWLKINNRRSIYQTMVDKYYVKEYVANIIGKEHIIKTVGIYEKFNDINFDKLPNSFVIKCTHDSNSTIVVRDKKNIDLKHIKKRINKALKSNHYYLSREWPYKSLKPHIIIEEYMYNKNINEKLIDYKFFCFNGNPTFIYVSEGLENHSTAKIDFFDINFKKASFRRSDFDSFDRSINKPKSFKRMIEIAKTLSKDIPFVRVDLYEIKNKVYFSELTFFPGGGFIRFEPEEWDKKIGDMLDISMVKNEK